MIERLIQDYLKDFAGSRILDLGPGYSDFSRFSARVIGASSITFLDNNAEVLAYQKERTLTEGIQSELVPGLITAESIAALAGPFDVIHCQEVLEHLVDAESVLAMLATKLSDRGRMIITVPSASSERIIRFINPGYMKDEQLGHVRQFTMEGLRRILKKAGLEPCVLIPVQPHYFLGHLWLFGTRAPMDGATGLVSGAGLRQRIFSLIVRSTARLFSLTGIRLWSRLFPRNYFAIARRGSGADTR